MAPEEIISKLKSTPYKFNYVNQIKQEAKKMEWDDLNRFKLELRNYMAQPENACLAKQLNDIVDGLSFNTAYQYN